MSLLWLIWVVALTLIAAACLWMLSLILLRLRHERTARRRASDRGAVIEALVAILQSAPDAGDRLVPYTGRARLLAEALLEFQALIRGSDNDLVLGELRRLGVVRVMAERLKRGSKAGRLSCVEALAALGGDEAETALRGALAQRDPDIRIAAMKGLSDIGADVSIAELMEMVRAGRLPPSRLLSEVVRQMAGRSPQEAIQVLTEARVDGLGRAMLLDALGSSGDYAVLPTLMDAAGDEDPEARTAALRSLGRLMHPAAEPAIAAALEDRAWPVRAAAAEAAGHARLTRLIDPLARLLDDPEWWVRFRAGEALALFGKTGVERLRQIARGAESGAQRAASLVLAERRL